MTPRGGRREGGGRKPLDGERRAQICVYLPAATLRRVDATRGWELRSHWIARVLLEELERDEPTPAR